MEVVVEQIGNKYDGEGYKTIEAVVCIRTPVKPYHPGEFRWNKPGEGADQSYIDKYDEALKQYNEQLEKYHEEYSKYIADWDEINRLHLGRATLEQATEKKVA